MIFRGRLLWKQFCSLFGCRYRRKALIWWVFASARELWHWEKDDNKIILVISSTQLAREKQSKNHSDFARSNRVCAFGASELLIAAAGWPLLRARTRSSIFGRLRGATASPASCAGAINLDGGICSTTTCGFLGTADSASINARIVSLSCGWRLEYFTIDILPTLSFAISYGSVESFLFCVIQSSTHWGWTARMRWVVERETKETSYLWLQFENSRQAFDWLCHGRGWCKLCESRGFCC